MVSHTYPAGTDLSGSPSHSAFWRDQIRPAIEGRLEVQTYATPTSLPAMGDFVGQMAYAGCYYRWNGAAWRVAGVALFSSTTDRDAAIPSPLVGDQCFVTADDSEYRCFTNGTWSLWSRPRTAWTPTFSGFSAGIAVAASYCWYQIEGGKITYESVFNCTGAVTAAATLTISGLPVAMASLPGFSPLEGVTHLNPNGTISVGTAAYATSTSVAIYYLAGTTSALTALSETAPATWSARSNAIMAHWSAAIA